MKSHPWLAGIEHILNSQSRRRNHCQRAIAAELLETKVLLAADTLGLIEGTVFNDITGDGLTGDDPRLNTVTVQLYKDGGNLTFDNGGADDTLVDSVTPVAGGAFSFADLASGRYFVRQQPIAGYMLRSGENVVTVDISATDALGAAGQLIDDFSQPGGAGQTLTANAAVTATSSSFAATSAAIGSERDMIVTATLGSVTFEANGAAFPSNLNYNANFGATGRSTVIWDGADNNPTTLSPSGLGGEDLTALGETGFLLSVGSSQPVTLSLIVHSGPTDSSTATINLAAGAIDTLYVPYSSFVTTTGTGADFANVGAIEFLTEAATATTTTVTDLLQAQAPTRFTANFANFLPMTLGNFVFNDINNNGVFDSSSEIGIDGVAMTLFEDTNGDQTLDGGDVQLATTTTAGGGLYSFSNLFPGDYIVRIDASNFGVAGPLEGFQSSTGNGTAPDADTNAANDDDNGDASGSAIASRAITLSNGLEPINDGDTDPNTNLSLDFGVFTTVDIVVTKTDNVDPVIAGSGVGNLVYTVTATNSGPGTATGLTLSDTAVITANLPAGVSFVSAVGSGGSTFSTTTGIWTIGTLNSGDSQTLTVTLTVGASASDSLVITNAASLATVNEIEVDAITGNDTATETTNVDRSVDIVVAKVENADPIIAGSGAGNLIYTITATNDGPSDASGITLGDTGIITANLPAGVTLVSAIGSGSTLFNATTGVWTIGSLAPGATATLVATLTAGASAADNLAIDNTASLLTVNETDADPNNNSASVRTDIDRNVDIEITKLATPTSVVAGSSTGNLVYTVTARNIGPSNASGVTVSDTDVLTANLPAGVSLVSAIGSGSTSFNSATGIWTIGSLASGASVTLTVTLSVGAAAVDNSTIANTATLNTVTETDTVLSNNTETVNVPVLRDVDVVVTKTVNSNSIVAGSGAGNLVYTVTARNAGPSNASNVTLLDTNVLAASLPAGVTFVSAVGSNSSLFNSTSGVWTIGSMIPGATETLVITLTVGATAADNLVVSNSASLATINETDRDLTNNSQTVTANVSREVDIQVSKSAAPATVIAGSGAGNLVYTVTTRNIGPSSATGVTISDTDILAANLPAGVTFVSAVGSGSTSYNATTGIWTVGSLGVGSSATLTVTLTVGATASDTLVINNTATLTAVNETDTVASNNTQSIATNVDRRVDLVVTKSTTNNPVTAGSGAGNLVYTITTRNSGPSNASGVTVRDNALLSANLPVGVTLVSAVGDGGSTYNSATGIWTIGNLAASVTLTLTVTVTVGAAAVPQTFNNTVQVASLNETDSNTNNNSASASTVFRRSVDIQVTKTATTGPVIAGSGTGNLVYTVTARNNGPSNATGVTLSDPGILVANLPAGVTFVSATGSGSSAFNATTGIWTIGSLATGETATLTVVLTVGASASDSLVISNTASLSTVTEPDSNASNNTQTVATNVDRRVDIVVTKTANAAAVAAGSSVGNLVYTVTARNAGSSDATNVTISDLGVLAANLPANVSYVSAVGSNGSTFNSTTGIWNIGNLNVGASRTLTITLTVGSAAVDGVLINNTAAVSTVTETETNLQNNQQLVSTRIIGGIDLVVVKTGAPNPVLSPGLLTYTVLVTNRGTGTATGVILTDNLGPGMRFSSGTSTQGTVTHANGIVTTTIGSISGGASVTLTLVASVNVALAGTLVNTASATADQTDMRPDDNVSSIRTQAELAPASVSGTVFQDTNRNGTRDAGERLLSDVQIVLFGTDVYGVAVNRRLVTNSNGTYSFTNLVPGRYSVYEIQPGFFIDSTDFLGSGATGTLTNDAFLNLTLNPGINAQRFNFTEGIEDLSKRPFLASSQNAGMTQIVSQPVTGTGSLSGSVATDTNRNGILDSGDIGIPGVIVTLAGNDTAGNPVLIHQSTDSLGRFAFSNLPAGQFSILETQPKGRTDGAEQTGTILPDQVLDDVFSAIALPAGGNGSGYNFLELPTTTGSTAATTPTLLTPTTNNVGLRPTISWTVITSAARYDVWVNQIGGNKGLVYRNQNVSDTSITIPEDLSLGTHRVWVRSINSAGVAGPWSQPLSFDVATQANALAVLGTSLNSKPVLDWADIPNATSYDLRLINAESGTVLANVSNLSTSQYAGLSALAPGRYRYFVRGNTATTKGQWSDGYDHTILSVPTLKTVTSNNTATPTLHWNAVAGATTYEVWLSALSTNSVAQRVASVNSTNATSMPVPVNLALGNYRYWVRAMDSQGKQTSWSSPSDFKVETGVKITNPVGTTNTSTPTFTWKPVAGAVRYDVWINDKSGNVYVRDQNVTGTSYTAARSFANGDYRVWVKAIGATTEGVWSATTAFTVKAISRPTLTAPGATTSSTPTFTWTASSGATRYELWVDKVGGPTKVVFKSNLTANSFKATTPLQTGSYRVWVRAFDSSGLASSWSAALEFRVV